MIIRRKVYFIVGYCISFFFLIIDTVIGIFQLLDIIHRGMDLLNTSEGQFRLMNLLIDIITLIGLSLFLLVLWRRLFIQVVEEEFVLYGRIFKIMVVVGGINILIAFLVLNNSFLRDLNLSISPFGHIYDITVKVGVIFLLLGIYGILSLKVEKQKIENLNGSKKI